MVWYINVKYWQGNALISDVHYKLWGRMKNKLLIGIMLVLTLLLLMPSIPAIQNNVIKDEMSGQIPENLDFGNIKKLKMIELMKHPILYLIVRGIFMFRLSRASILLEWSTEVDYSGLVVTRPIIFLRSIWLAETGAFVYNYLEAMFGWNI